MSESYVQSLSSSISSMVSSPMRLSASESALSTSTPSLNDDGAGSQRNLLKHPQPNIDQTHRQTQQDLKEIDNYKILSSSEILDRLQSLAEKYPAFATLTTTQEWFDLPRAGSRNDCSFDLKYEVGGVGCNNYVLVVLDKEKWLGDVDLKLDVKDFSGIGTGSSENDGSGWKYLPDVFLSGAVHGNERVGPTALIEMAELLLESAQCESFPRMRLKPDSNDGDDGAANASSNKLTEEEWQAEILSAHQCRAELVKKGIPPPYRQWLARLVSSRRTIIIPTANALGYAQDERTENGVDPNRDFPFDITKDHSGECMKTVAGRSINELWRSHLFQIGLTFHGGTEVIGYEWGAPTYLSNAAPDTLAQNTIASAYSHYANSFQSTPAYDYGTMNDKVYYVRGGMEDWAFAGSWDPDRVVVCTPNTFGGYAGEKTKYNNSTLRAFNMLIETSKPKTPSRGSLGKPYQPLVSASSEANGHIARNIRLALLAIDVVEPYVSIQAVEGLRLEEEDLTPGVNSRESFFEDSRMIWIPANARRRVKASQNVEEKGVRGTTAKVEKRHSQDRETEARTVRIEFTVGGAFDVDAAEILYGPWDSLPGNLANTNDGFYPSRETFDRLNSDFQSATPTNIDLSNDKGRTRWHGKGPFPMNAPDPNANYEEINPQFETQIDVSSFPPNTKLAIFARARVDSSWMTQPSNVGPEGLGPASHLVNTRTNPGYLAMNAGKIVKGREGNWWHSGVVTLVIGEGITDSSEGTGMGGSDGGGEMEIDLVQEAKMNNAPMITSPDGHVQAVHINARLGGTPQLMETLSRPKPSTPTNNGPFNTISDMGGVPSETTMPFLLLALAAVVILTSFIVLVVKRRRRKYLHRQKVKEQLEDLEEEEFSVGVEIPNEGQYHD